MTNNDIRIGRFSTKPTATDTNHHYTLLWIRDSEKDLIADHILFEKVKNILFFLHPHHSWRLVTPHDENSQDYIVMLSEAILNEPAFDRLELTRLRILYSHHIHQAPISALIDLRLDALLERLSSFIVDGYPTDPQERAIVSQYIYV